jgi:hypothetical protein
VNENKDSLADVFRMLHGSNVCLYFQPSTNTVGNAETFFNPKGKKLSEEQKGKLFDSLIVIIGIKHEEHKEVRSCFVRESIDDKTLRKKLFDALRHRTDFYDRFDDICKNNGVYEDYINCSEDIYIDIASDWYKKNETEILRLKNYPVL